MPNIEAQVSREAQKLSDEDAGRDTIILSSPVGEDGKSVHDLIAACPPLDTNSLYANLLQCTDFSNTCCVARQNGEAIAWVSGYIPPEQPDVYFLWQVAVGKKARGQGLPKKLITNILSRPNCQNVRFIKTTITPDNAASWGLFRSVAKMLQAPLDQAPHFDRNMHFGGHHDSEIMVTIGPFERLSNA